MNGKSNLSKMKMKGRIEINSETFLEWEGKRIGNLIQCKVQEGNETHNFDVPIENDPLHVAINILKFYEIYTRVSKGG